ncbi:MAG: hypothetical protein GY811_23650 [Myxococcales bacterium]|nr:hypothetical protein [Myxococcales bacterium]
MGLIRSLLSLSILALFIVVGATVPVGDRTLFGHVSNIWAADETQELVDGVKESSGPLVDRVKRGVQAGLADDSDAEPIAAEPEREDAQPLPEQP